MADIYLCGDFEWRIEEGKCLVTVIGGPPEAPIIETELEADAQRLQDLIHGAAWALERLETTA